MENGKEGEGQSKYKVIDAHSHFINQEIIKEKVRDKEYVKAFSN